jgi:DNA-binding PadR family transcriptional regulator
MTSEPPIKLKPISYLVLGMLRLGAKSGYAIKKAADASTASFWPTSLAQVYPELARLERHSLVTRRDDRRGARERSAYELTEAGEAALLAWLRSPVDTPPQIRSESLLRFFFANALPKDDQLALLRRMRERVADRKTHIYNPDVPAVTTALKGEEVRFPQLTADYAVSLLAFTERWLAELEAELGE